MKIIAKVLLIIFFFVFSFSNTTIGIGFQDTSDTNPIKHQYGIEMDDGECCIALPSSHPDNGTISGAGGIQNSNATNPTFRNENKLLINKSYIISHLYKTEIFPNAP